MTEQVFIVVFFLVEVRDSIMKQHKTDSAPGEGFFFPYFFETMVLCQAKHCIKMKEEYFI